MDAITRARITGQSGLVTRAQALGAGLSRKAIEWRLSRGQWTVLHPGVYLTTPGRDEWEMRAVAALLYAGSGAVLCGRSAGHVWGLVKQEPSTIEVAVPTDRLVRPQPGVLVVRGRHTVERTHPTEWPHRIDAPHTVWDLSAGKEFDRAAALAAKAVQLGITTAEQLRAALQDRARQPHRTVLLQALTHVDAGAESPAEVRYVRDAARAHGLPRGTVQKPTGDGGRRDVEYEEHGVIVEVDGRLAHNGWAARRKDGKRDRQALASGKVTVRCHWTDLVPTACELADDIAAILTERGWRGEPRPCRRKGCQLRRPSATPAERDPGRVTALRPSS